jgi:hypothetical protein
MTSSLQVSPEQDIVPVPDKKMMLGWDILFEDVHSAVQLDLVEVQVQVQDLGVLLLCIQCST